MSELIATKGYKWEREPLQVVLWHCRQCGQTVRSGRAVTQCPRCGSHNISPASEDLATSLSPRRAGPRGITAYPILRNL